MRPKRLLLASAALSTAAASLLLYACRERREPLPGNPKGIVYDAESTPLPGNPKGIAYDAGQPEAEEPAGPPRPPDAGTTRAGKRGGKPGSR
jgi:hypothetical protein